MPLTELGYSRASYDEIVSDMEQRAKKELGENIDTTEQSVFGKFLRIIARDLANVYEDIESGYYSRFPNSAVGVSLDRLAVFAGITRNPATAARHNITVNGTADTTVGMGGLLVSTEDNITFYNENGFTIGADGTANVIVAATEMGVSGNVNTITKIVNPVTGITSISYVGLEEVGEDSESDPDLRQRFSVSVSGAGSCTVDAIRGSVTRITEVESVNIMENNSSETDAAGRPAHSFELYVYGGDGMEQEIAETIFEKKPIGIKAVTTASGDHAVTKTVVDAGGFEHPVSFSKVMEVAMDIAVTIKTSAAFAEDGEETIKNNLVRYIDGLGVGASVVTSAMYPTIFSVTGVKEIVRVAQARTGEALSTDTIHFDLSEVPITTATNITIIDDETASDELTEAINELEQRLDGVLVKDQ